MNILLVLNKPNREMAIMQSVKKELLLMDPHAHVEIWEMCTPHFNADVLRFKPDVILTFPFTCTGFATWYYLFKLLFACKVLTLRAEGVVDLSSEYNVQWAVGFDRYGRYLVDHELFWGSLVANAIGHNLLKQGKLSSLDRVRLVGYPRLESYFSPKSTTERTVLPDRLTIRINSYDRRDIIFFATGFHLANYTRQDLFDARDLDAENRIDELLDAVEITRRFRQAWIESVIATAEQNPDLLIIVKKHPIEKKEDYLILERLTNVLYVYEDVDIQHLMPHAGLFLHYGSTSLVDSYLSRIPSVYVSSPENKSWYSDLGWPSSRKVAVSDVPRVVSEYRTAGIPFAMTDDIKAVLKSVFDIEEGLSYRPSRRIAEVILEKDPAQKIPLTDKYLWKALLSIGISVLVRRTSRTIKFLLRIDPNEPLLRRKCSPR